MPYRYHCTACAASGTQHPRRSSARADQERHRRAAHGGMAPDRGDGVRYAVPSAKGPAIIVGILLLLILIKEVTGLAPDDVARHFGLIP